MMNGSITLTLLCALVLGSGCSKKQEPSSEPTPQAVAEKGAGGLPSATREQLKADLEWLKAEDRALVVEAPGTTKFVQFSGSGLKFDLPVMPLSQEEAARAEETMKRLGIPKTTFETTTIGADQKPVVLVNYKKDLGGDVPAALNLVEVVFVEVFELPPTTKLEGQRVM
ncbi:MAG: hypothetical protein AAF436_10170 [Myxococcota bacterium]